MAEYNITWYLPITPVLVLGHLTHWSLM